MDENIKTLTILTAIFVAVWLLPIMLFGCNEDNSINTFGMIWRLLPIYVFGGMAIVNRVRKGIEKTASTCTEEADESVVME